DCMKEAFREARKYGMSVEEAYAYAKKVYEQNRNNPDAPKKVQDENFDNARKRYQAQRKQDALATIKSVRRYAEKICKKSSKMQGILADGEKDWLYGIFFHQEVNNRLKNSPGVKRNFPELTIEGRIDNPNASNDDKNKKGNYRIPDYQWGEVGDSDYQIWDLKPSDPNIQNKWEHTDQYKDMDDWTNCKPKAIGYNKENPESQDNDDKP
ncbi:MAG: hypothetical protein K2N34_09965, partial [Lachnospiraceae bacterium]|nr:hypothetical protein [Lachnospiraceae bacterium]